MKITVFFFLFLAITSTNLLKGQTLSETDLRRQLLSLDQTQLNLYKYANTVSYGQSVMILGAMGAGIGLLLSDGGNTRTGRPLTIGGASALVVGGFINMYANRFMQQAGKRRKPAPVSYN